MQVTIDKFGRILIPKKVRQLIGLVPGHTIELKVNEDEQRITLRPKEVTAFSLEITEDGIPIFTFPGAEEADFDVVELIKQDREERDAKSWGNGN